MTRGFSLIELLVGLVCAVVLLTSATAVFLAARQESVRGAVRNQIGRDTTLVLDSVEHDLTFLGAGVPFGTCQDGATCASAALLPAIRIGADNDFAFVGDLPFPNAELNGVANIARLKGDATDDELAVTSEVSGTCVPFASAAAAPFQVCKTHLTTLLPQTFAAADDCKEASPGARTCPWALNKWINAVDNSTAHLIAVDPTGNWYERNWSGTLSAQTPYFGIHFDHNFPVAGQPTLPRGTFFTPVGDAYLAQLDRVFYALEDAATPGTVCAGTSCVLVRKQCWGAVGDPTAASFPAAGTSTFFGSASAIGNCSEVATPPDGTPWETIATHIESLQFRYFNASAAPLPTPLSTANARLVRAVEVTVAIARDAAGTTLRETGVRRIFLDNRETP